MLKGYTLHFFLYYYSVVLDIVNIDSLQATQTMMLFCWLKKQICAVSTECDSSTMVKIQNFLFTFVCVRTLHFMFAKYITSYCRVCTFPFIVWCVYNLCVDFSMWKMMFYTNIISFHYHTENVCVSFDMRALYIFRKVFRWVSDFLFKKISMSKNLSLFLTKMCKILIVFFSFFFTRKPFQIFTFLIIFFSLLFIYLLSLLLLVFQ